MSREFLSGDLDKHLGRQTRQAGNGPSKQTPTASSAKQSTGPKKGEDPGPIAE